MDTITIFDSRKESSDGGIDITEAGNGELRKL